MKIAINRFAGPVIALSALLALSACTTTTQVDPNAAVSRSFGRRVIDFFKPYKPEVQQGNVITRDMVDQIRPGMTRDQVRFMLGTPMLRDIFHEERWDYPYILTRGTGQMQTRKLVIFFAEGHVKSFESDPMPAEPLADTLIFQGRSEIPELRTKAPGQRDDEH
jgi:outer membrane protein assembly factor BamE